MANLGACVFRAMAQSAGKLERVLVWLGAGKSWDATKVKLQRDYPLVQLNAWRVRCFLAACFSALQHASLQAPVDWFEGESGHCCLVFVSFSSTIKYMFRGFWKAAANLLPCFLSVYLHSGRIW
jgi:hypothetical protein